MTPAEIRALIEETIKGQGTQIDAGSSLPTILNAILAAAEAASVTVLKWNETRTQKVGLISYYAITSTQAEIDTFLASISGKLEKADFYLVGSTTVLKASALTQGQNAATAKLEIDGTKYIIYLNGTAQGGNSYLTIEEPRERFIVSVDSTPASTVGNVTTYDVLTEQADIDEFLTSVGVTPDNAYFEIMESDETTGPYFMRFPLVEVEEGYVVGKVDVDNTRYQLHLKSTALGGDSYLSVTTNDAVTSASVSVIWTGTQAEYDALTEKLATTLYIIKPNVTA